jgi:hypothetical protein
LSFWKENPDLLPQQFNSESLYPALKESIAAVDTQDDDVPSRPGFPQPAVTGAAADQLQFTATEDIEDIFKKPAIGELYSIMYISFVR